MLILLFFSALFFHLPPFNHAYEHAQSNRRPPIFIGDLRHVFSPSLQFGVYSSHRTAAERPFRILSSSVRAPPPATSFFSPFHGPPLLLFLSVTSRVTSFLCETLFVSRCTCSTRTMPVCTVKKHDRRERERKGQRERERASERKRAEYKKGVKKRAREGGPGGRRICVTS